MEQVVFFGAMVGVFFIVNFLSAKKKDGCLRHFSRGRGDLMRNLNKKMEREQEDGRKVFSKVLMKRFLSHIVIMALLVISPVSFSTSEINNFYVLVTVDAPLKESRKASIVVAHWVAKTIGRSNSAISPYQCFSLLPTLPAIDCNRITEHGRAPPVVPTA